MESKRDYVSNHHRLVAFFVSIPIGLLGGLIGLGGAEFRLPVLVGVLKRQVHEAVPINLSVSLITIIASILIRLRGVSEFPFKELLPVLLSMIFGAVFAAAFAAGWASRISSRALEGWMKFLLISIGLLLIVEGFVAFPSADLIHHSILFQSAVGIIAGVLIGVVSSTLGVAGGELIIPTLVFIFGLGVKVAGTASLLISLPTVCSGLFRYYRSNAFFNRLSAVRIVTPMGIGSVLGSLLGGLLFVYVSSNGIKVFLGSILIYSAVRMFLNPHSSKSA